MAAISDLLQGCLSQLKSLIESDVLSDHVEVPLQAWTDELGRLRIWAANIGAHQTRQSSLDYRLRDASHIKGQIMRLLTHIQEVLTDLQDVLEEGSDGEAQHDRFKERGDISGEEYPTEIQEIHQSLVETITQLYQMSMIIRNPAQHDRLVGTDRVDSEPFQFWAKQHVSTKYPNADALAIDRISHAMARQRAILKYRERHHAKLSQGIDLEGDAKSTLLSETVVTDVFQEQQGGCSDMVSDAGISETSYGGTLLEGTGEDAPKIPPIPKKGAEQRPFECPYCFYIITVRDKRAWARHIFRDLMPYVCVFPGCSTPNKLYDGRRQWYHHIKQAHNISIGSGTYGCFICRQGSFPVTTFQRHVGRHLEELALFFLPRNYSDEDESPELNDDNDPGSSGASLSDTNLDNYSLKEAMEQREDLANAAIPATLSDTDGGSFVELPSQSGENHILPAVTRLSDRDIADIVEHDMESEEPGLPSSGDPKQEAIARLKMPIQEEKEERKRRETEIIREEEEKEREEIKAVTVEEDRTVRDRNFPEIHEQDTESNRSSSPAVDAAKDEAIKRFEKFMLEEGKEHIRRSMETLLGFWKERRRQINGDQQTQDDEKTNDILRAMTIEGKRSREATKGKEMERSRSREDVQ